MFSNLLQIIGLIDCRSTAISLFYVIKFAITTDLCVGKREVLQVQAKETFQIQF